MLVLSIAPLLRVSLSVRFTFLWLHMLLWLLLGACVGHHLHLGWGGAQYLVHAAPKIINTFNAIHGCDSFIHRAVGS